MNKYECLMWAIKDTDDAISTTENRAYTAMTEGERKHHLDYVAQLQAQRQELAKALADGK